MNHIFYTFIDVDIGLNFTHKNYPINPMDELFGVVTATINASYISSLK